MPIPGQPQRNAGKILKLLQIAIVLIVVVTISLAPRSEWFKGMVGVERVQNETQEQISEKPQNQKEGALVFEYVDIRDNQKDNLLASIKLTSDYQDLDISDILIFIEGVRADSIRDLKIIVDGVEMLHEALSNENRLFVTDMDLKIPKDSEKTLEIFGSPVQDTQFKIYVIDVVGKDALGGSLANIGAKNDPFTFGLEKRQ